MASSRGTKGSHIKNPKKEDDDDDFLEDLVVESEKAEEANNLFKSKTGRFCDKS